MPLDASQDAAERARALNARFPDGEAALDHALTDPGIGEAALVSSFGAESVVLLHMVARLDPRLPVLFLDTEMLFPETLDYQAELAETLGLRDLRVIRPDPVEAVRRDPDGRLHLADPEACCGFRKVDPLARALAPFDAWITGRKRFQGGRRTELQHFEAEGERLKVNPLAKWSAEDLADYIAGHGLPRHPLVSQGYRSIGCAPCTSPVGEDEDPRDGRWRGQDKDECGIHFEGGVVLRGRVLQGASQ